MSRYIQTPSSIKWQDVIGHEFSLSSSQYASFMMPNKNYKNVSEFLTRPLRRKDLGVEVGSLNYIDRSPYSFIRTKALQEHSFLLSLNKETILPIKPSEFVQMNLKEGDLLISKDSNIGEIVILDKDYPNCMLSGAIYRLPVKNEWRYYLLAFIKHDVFREQLDSMVPKGATIRHAKTMFLDCKIPLANYNTEKVIRYISLLTQVIVNKEKLIRLRHANIMQLINKELTEHQNTNTFSYRLPTLDEIKDVGRLDTNMYNSYFKNETFKIMNYSNGYQNIEGLGFEMSRGQNLQVSNIGKSIYSKEWHHGFYTLVLPMCLSKFGTVDEIKYLGNRNSLKTLKKGDLIFGAEGFEKGRSIVVIEEETNTITNIHGITLKQEAHNLTKAIFVKCFLDYLRSKGMVDLFAVGGNGGSLAQKYWPYIPFPNFPESKQKEIAALYYNSKEYDTSSFTLDNFSEKDNEFNSEAGIYELDKTAKQLKRLLDKAIDDIVNDREVEIRFSE
jgi:type I restriction enzyme S subunit